VNTLEEERAAIAKGFRTSYPDPTPEVVSERLADEESANAPMRSLMQEAERIARNRK
jgi:hypothetical protein